MVWAVDPFGPLPRHVISKSRNFSRHSANWHMFGQTRMAGEDRWMAESLNPGQSSQLLIAYRATFTADNHGDALKAMYSKFEVVFGVPRNVLHAEVMADRQAHAKLYRKLRNEL